MAKRSTSINSSWHLERNITISDTMSGKNMPPGLKTESDALKVRERILLSLEQAEQIKDVTLRQPHLTYVVIGGGPTGVETAGAIAKRAKITMRRNFRNITEDEIRVYLIEAAPNILNSFSEPLGDKGTNSLEKLGVRVLKGTPVTKLEMIQYILKSARSKPSILFGWQG